MKHWKIVYKNTKQEFKKDGQDIVNILLHNREIIGRAEIEKFLAPMISEVALISSGIDKKEFDKFKKRIEIAIRKSEKIIVYGDYDVDGITSTAILWETLFSKTKNVLPYIPDRTNEGYGLSIAGIDNILSKSPDTKIIVTVDNGIVAYDACSYAKEKGIDVVVTDHHVKGKKLPDSFCILHTTYLCGAGIAWVIAKTLSFESQTKIREKLELATLGTIADLVPLVGNNRAIVFEGLKILQQTKRFGLLELLSEANFEPKNVGVYTIGHIIAPRLNATGRIQNAMNALRLLCTHDPLKAKSLAVMLGGVNRDRQDLTKESVAHARLLAIENESPCITIVSDPNYNQGIIGLVASQLVEAYYKPAIAIAVGEEVSKGSARSIKGVNIIELLRSVSETLIEAGGHPMAAGFSVATSRIDEFKIAILKKAKKIVTTELLKRYVTIDMLLQFEQITKVLISEISKLEPYGMGNPDDFKLNIEVNHATLAGHSFQHEIQMAADTVMLGSIDANRGDQQNGWDTD